MISFIQNYSVTRAKIYYFYCSLDYCANLRKENFKLIQIDIKKKKFQCSTFSH